MCTGKNKKKQHSQNASKSDVERGKCNQEEQIDMMYLDVNGKCNIFNERDKFKQQIERKKSPKNRRDCNKYEENDKSFYPNGRYLKDTSFENDIFPHTSPLRRFHNYIGAKGGDPRKGQKRK